MRKVNLSDVCEVIAGQSPPSSTYNQDGNGIPFFQGKADFGLLYPTVRYWCSEPNKLSKPNDILFSLRAPVGPTNINNIDACIGRGLAAIRCSEQIVTKYLLYYLRGNEEKIASLGTGSTFKAITIGTLKSLQIPLPPLPEQRRIASLLDTADRYRERTRALLEQYELLVQSVFLEMFGDVFVNKKGYELVFLKDIIERVQVGPFGSQLHSSDYITNGIPLINPTQINNRKIEHDSEVSISLLKYNSLPQYHLKEGDVIMGRRGEMGRCAIVKRDQSGWFCGTGSLFIRPSENINSMFLLYVLSEEGGINYLTHNAKGVTMKNLNKSIINNMQIGIPPLPLQQQFASRVEAIERQKAQVRASLEGAEALFGGLLGEFFGG